MTPAVIIREAPADGVNLALSAHTVEVDTPSGWNPRRLASLCRALPRWVRRDCDRRASQASRAPIKLDEALRAACEGVAGITVELFRSLLSPEDMADIAASAIHPKTLKAYALLSAEGIRSGRLAPAVAP